MGLDVSKAKVSEKERKVDGHARSKRQGMIWSNYQLLDIVWGEVKGLCTSSTDPGVFRVLKWGLCHVNCKVIGRDANSSRLLAP